MFNLIFEAISAYTQLLYVVGGAVCSGIGLLILGFAAYLRVHEHVYAAEVIGVREERASQAMFWPVLAYVDEKGERHEGLANSGSSLIGGRTPGTKTMVLADPASPQAPMLVRDWWVLLAIGAVIVAVGYPFLRMGLRNLQFNWITFTVAVAISVHLAIRIFGFVHPLLDARKSNEWKAAQLAHFRDKQQSREALPLASEVEIATTKAQQSKWFASALPVLSVVGVLLFIGGGIALERDLTFLAKAVAGEGVVVRNDATGSGNSSPSYHAVVLFTDRIGRRIEFRDPFGSSPPWYRTGDTVKVFYLPEDPGRPMIDHGVWNWLVALLAAIGGVILLGLSAHFFRTRRTSAAS